ncbi:hypothetical protein VTN49DRAFT_1340 [Thermomyces lanuginosus]|uniref:uncharacterized protein n=1 Tax=Thermomyces lanuginosus TaxID=5541 RepID=UPI003742F3A5
MPFASPTFVLSATRRPGWSGSAVTYESNLIQTMHRKAWYTDGIIHHTLTHVKKDICEVFAQHKHAASLS